MPADAQPGRNPRVFLGWSEPALPRAAAWLLDEGVKAGADLSGVLVVVPGSRAQRRLLELLAVAAVGRALVPPTVVTLGGLAGRLMPRVFEGYPGGVAGEAEAWLTRASVLQEAERSLIEKLSPIPPDAEDWPGWWSLARQWGDVADELGAGLLLPGEVRGRCAALVGDARWQAIEALDQRYHAMLAERGRLDTHHARRLTIEEGLVTCEQQVVLLAAMDLMPVHRALLSALPVDQLTPLIFTPAEHAEGFDRFGGLVEAYWRDRHPPIDDRELVFVDRPVDQAAAVLRACKAWHEDQPVSADQITIGIGGTLGPTVRRTLELAGLPARSATGQPAQRSRPALLLQALAAYAERGRFDDLANLLRHPDVEDFVQRAARAEAGSDDGSDATQAVGSWLGLLDRYATDHLRGRVTGHWLGKPEVAEPLKRVHDAVLSLLPGNGPRRRPLGEWARPIGEALHRVYGHRPLGRFDETDRAVVLALELIGGVLSEMLELAKDVQPTTGFPQAVRYVLERLSGRPIPEPGGEPAIELVGFLELLLDDAPRLAVVGLNEGAVPEPTRFNPLLPDSARRDLGLPGDAHRLARDKLALTAMLQCRKGVRLVSGRYAADGEPLMPSRLLLSAEDEALVGRVARFFDEGVPAEPPLLLLSPGPRDRFLIPYPTLDHPTLTRLRVTAFRDYLACPYRFYLRHVLRLSFFDDREVELNAAAFGNLAHDALQVLALPHLREQGDAEVVAEHLGMELDRVFSEKLGDDPPAAARLQLENLRYRLRFAAVEHAQMVAEGWRIGHTELPGKADILVDGEPFTITGKIDRIDTHPNLGHRIIDYKTGDRGKSPQQTHRAKALGSDTKHWTDLQLPLYLDLAAEHGIGRGAELGYFNLPKNEQDTRFVGAAWDEALLSEAMALRDEVVRKVRAGVFWPPKLEPPRFDDGFAAIAADHAADRAGIIQRSAPGGEGVA
ncbi:MAG: PD-(D/E)XK nuclease family protein [Planctomycetota bacterium]